MTNQHMIELDERTLEAVSAGGGVHQSNYKRITRVNVSVSADTTGFGNTGGYNIVVIQDNTN